jgi:hypothetical protein
VRKTNSQNSLRTLSVTHGNILGNGRQVILPIDSDILKREKGFNQEEKSGKLTKLEGVQEKGHSKL